MRIPPEKGLNRMKITGGAAKGRRIGRPGPGIRPTSAKVREALFDILRSRAPGGTFLDLCAGTGAVGVEALSRGYDRVVFVDAESGAVRDLERRLDELGLRPRADVRLASALDYIDSAAKAGKAFDVVFIDLPYASAEAAGLLDRIAAGGLLRAGGCVVVEHAARTPPPEPPRLHRKARTYRYGDTALSLYVQE